MSNTKPISIQLKDVFFLQLLFFTNAAVKSENGKYYQIKAEI